jgi:S1-C subfamily serine protease
MFYQGTGFLIAKNVIATANHVAEDQTCIDKTTGEPLKTYKTDKRHDFALMTEAAESVGPYTRYSCQRPDPGQYYISYGWSSLGMPDFFTPILRNNNLLSTKRHSKTGDVSSFLDSSGMRIYNFPIAAGTSGGPVADIFGNVIAINNAGNDEETLLFDLADTALCTGKWDK